LTLAKRIEAGMMQVSDVPIKHNGNSPFGCEKAVWNTKVTSRQAEQTLCQSRFDPNPV
jgi:hypothetical protein